MTNKEPNSPVFSEQILKECFIKKMPPLSFVKRLTSEDENSILFLEVNDGIFYIYDELKK